MDEEIFNTDVRKYLKKLGITAQREIEKAVRQGIEAGTLKGTEALTVRATVEIDGIQPGIVVDGSIRLS